MRFRIDKVRLIGLSEDGETGHFKVSVIPEGAAMHITMDVSFEQKTWAKVIADSIDPFGYRITTFEVQYPTTILQQFEKHRALPRSVVYSTASMRARPVASLVEEVENNPFVPSEFRKNQKGMQPGDGLSEVDAAKARNLWIAGAQTAAKVATELAALGVHKELANRPLTPYAWTRSIVTGTDWQEFYRLRTDADAQGEFRVLAEAMKEAHARSAPRAIQAGEWHMPYRDPESDPSPGEYASAFDMSEIRTYYRIGSNNFDALLLCAARAARVSYLTHEKTRDLQADLTLARGLIKNVHMTPFEHVAQAMGDDSYFGPLRAWRPLRMVVSPRQPELTRTWRDVEDDYRGLRIRVRATRLRHFAMRRDSSHAWRCANRMADVLASQVDDARGRVRYLSRKHHHDGGNRRQPSGASSSRRANRERPSKASP